MEGAGKQLKRKRQLLNITLERVHHDTRISLSFLEALEDDRYDSFPAEIYLIGFMKKYAAYLKMQAEPLINEYKSFKLSQLDQTKKELKEEKIIEKEKSMAMTQQGIFLGAVILLGIGVLVSIFFIVKSKSSLALQPALVREKRFLTVAETSHKQNIPLELIISSLAKSWVRVEVDGKMVFEGMYPASTVHHWKADNTFTVITQDWKALEIKLNGQEIIADTITDNPHQLVLDRRLCAADDSGAL